VPDELRTGNPAVVAPWNQVVPATDRQSTSPSREETLISDQVITIAGRSVTITSHDVFMAGLSLAIGLLFWIAVYFSRKRIVVLNRSSALDQVTFELSRIADALDRIANHPAERAIAAASRRQLQPPAPPQRESQGVAYSMFGR
jgi:hypothetical protein